VILAIAVGGAMALVSVATLSVNPEVSHRWGIAWTRIEWNKLLPLSPAPILAGLAFIVLLRSTKDAKAVFKPYIAAATMFLAGYAGLALSIAPHIVPYQIDIWTAAARNNALSLMLVGVAIMLPIILGYTGYVYWIFRGKIAEGQSYEH
ncbi:MAG: cytochrome d ubiquinol oxidase subunit II, partial [Rhodospirillaceae bacterium]